MMLPHGLAGTAWSDDHVELHLAHFGDAIQKHHGFNLKINPVSSLSGTSIPLNSPYTAPRGRGGFLQ